MIGLNFLITGFRLWGLDTLTLVIAHGRLFIRYPDLLAICSGNSLRPIDPLWSFLECAVNVRSGLAFG